MKKTILVITIMISTILTYAQIEVKGFILGSKYYGEDKVVSSLGNIKGCIYIKTLNDHRIWSITFEASDPFTMVNFTSDGKHHVDPPVCGLTPKILSYAEVHRLKKGIEKRYSIDFKEVKNPIKVTYNSEAILDNFRFRVEVKNEHSDKTIYYSSNVRTEKPIGGNQNEFRFNIVDTQLEKLYYKEENDSFYSDF